MFEFADCSQTLVKVHRRLLGHFGQPGPYAQLDPVSQLVMGLVGGRTRGEVSLSAYRVLSSRFGSWEVVRDASPANIQKAISQVTFAEVKAYRLRAALSMVTRLNGKLTLENLKPMSVIDALLWLERLPGVGRKTSAATVNFSTLRKPALVIDTHHLRVMRRFGLVGARTDFRQAYDRIMPALPASWDAAEMDLHHQLMKLLGQSICRHQTPTCNCCPVSDLCASAIRKLADEAREPELSVLGSR